MHVPFRGTFTCNSDTAGKNLRQAVIAEFDTGLGLEKDNVQKHADDLGCKVNSKLFKMPNNRTVHEYGWIQLVTGIEKLNTGTEKKVLVMFNFKFKINDVVLWNSPQDFLYT